jgi:hypothetical protein
MQHIALSTAGFFLMAGVMTLLFAADSRAGFIHLTPEQVPFKHPAGAVHWDGAGPQEETIVQVIGMGPVETVQIDPQAPEFSTFPK